jgi:hypothetical protein
MSDHAGTNSRGRTIALSLFFICLAGVCMAALNAEEANRQTAHPCNAIRASLALDTAKFGVEDEPGELVVGVYNVEGDAVRGAQVTLTTLASADMRYGGNVGPDGLSHIARIDPGRYHIKVRWVGFEEQAQILRIIPARTDTLCFVMRSFRFPIGFEIR